MKRMSLRTLLTLAAVFALPVHADTGYLTGPVSDLTSFSDGSLGIRLSNGVPGNCTGVAYGWMSIPASNKTMIAVALLVWQNKGSVTAYTDALSGGLCTINQFDPVES